MFFVLYCRRLSLLLKCARGEFYLFMLWSLIKSDHHNMLHGRIERRIYVPTWSLAKKESERERERNWCGRIECCNNFSSQWNNCKLCNMPCLQFLFNFALINLFTRRHYTWVFFVREPIIHWSASSSSSHKQSELSLPEVNNLNDKIIFKWKNCMLSTSICSDWRLCDNESALKLASLLCPSLFQRVTDWLEESVKYWQLFSITRKKEIFVCVLWSLLPVCPPSIRHYRCRLRESHIKVKKIC